MDAPAGAAEGGVRMDRLTKRKDGGCHVMDCENCRRGDCTALYCRNRLKDRLAVIEDILGDNYDLDRLRELVEADKEGRCKILPVNLGDTVYYIGGIHGKLVCEVKVEEIYIWDDTISLGVTSGFGVFTLEENEYFLTKESAEAALKGE